MFTGAYGFTAGGGIGRGRRHKGNLRRVLPRSGFADVLDQPHGHGAVGADRFKALEGIRVAIDGLLQLRARVAQVLGAQENRRNARVDHGGLEGAYAGHLEVIDQLPRGEEGALAIGGIEEVHGDLGGGEGDSIELEIPRFLHGAIGHGHLVQEAFFNIRLPNAHFAGAVSGHPGWVHEPFGDGKGPHGRGQVAAVAGPVDEGGIDGHLAEEVVHIVPRAIALAYEHHLRGAGGGAAHAVRVLSVGVGAADHPKAQRVPGGPRHLGLGRKVGDIEEHALRGAPAQIGGADFLLRREGTHPWASRKSSAKR
jgi:hypothetical protein